MNTTVITGATEKIEAVQQMPCVSIVLPFNPAMSLKKELTNTLKDAADYAEAALHKDYPEDISLLLMQKLNTILKELNFYTNRKSIAVFVSPVFAKVLYLDMLVNAKVKVADSFQVKELIGCKKQLKQYLLLQTTKEGFKIYVGSTGQLIKIVSAPYSNPGYIISAKNENSSPGEAAINHIDQTLEIIVQTYKMPMLAAGTDYMTDQLKQYSRFSKKFIDYIILPEIDLSPYHLQQLSATLTADWDKVIERNLHNCILNASAENKLVTGIKPVWREAMNHKSSLLIIEKDFQCNDAGETSEEVIQKAIEPYSSFSYIRNTTDEIIEKVLEDGGDVEFAAENSLDEYDHIVLVTR